jgi:putative RecB family exonuclease
VSERFSHSRLSSFEDCPKKYEYRYVLKIPRETESIEGFVGKRVHEVLERLYTATGRGHVPTLPQVIHRYRALFDEKYDPERVRVVREETPLEEYRENGERGLTNYYRRHYPFDGDETLGLEERVSFDLDGDGHYRILGFVDRISRARDGVIEIHDYKTGRWVPDQKQLDGDRQLALYQIGVMEKFGEGGAMRLVWHYVLRNQVRTSTRTPEQLASLRTETARLIDRIRAAERFEPKPSALCSWCEYNDICPAVAVPGGDASRATRGEGPVAATEAPAASSRITDEAPDAGARRKSGQLTLL